MTLPVTKRAAGEISHAAASAISSGTPTRRKGVIASMRSRKPGWAIWSRVKSVAVKPGATALTRTPSGPTSVARPLVKLSTAPLVAA